ncbi:MAG: WD40 repeat domain-containing protein [Armatimonadetes bacterium]|nr:WD40 repeat domain-containing protein [Armatimonadota bacterium]
MAVVNTFPLMHRRDGGFSLIAWSENGERLIQANGRRLRSWDTSNWTLAASHWMHSDFVRVLKVDPLTHAIAFETLNSVVKVDPQTLDQLGEITFDSEDAIAASMSPDGKFVCRDGSSQTRYWSAGDPSRTHVVLMENGWGRCDFHPTLPLLAIPQESQIVVRNLLTNLDDTVLPLPFVGGQQGLNATSMVLLGDGSRMVIARTVSKNQTYIWCVDWRTRETVWVRIVPKAMIRVWTSPSRTKLAITIDPEGTVAFLDPADGSLIAQTLPMYGYTYKLAFSNAEDEVAVTAYGGLLYRFSTADATERLYTYLTSSLVGIAYSPDDSQLYIGDGFGSLHVVRTSDGAEQRFLDVDCAEINDIKVDNLHRKMLVCKASGTVFLADLP